MRIENGDWARKDSGRGETRVMDRAETKSEATGAWEFTALDGGVVTVSSAASLGRHTSSLVLGSPLGRSLFETGGSSFGRSGAAKDFGIEDFDQTFDFEGGVLSLGSAVVRNPNIPNYESLCFYAVWEGESRSLTTHLYDAGYDRLLASVDMVQLRETSSGLVLTPKLEAAEIIRTASRAPDVIVHGFDFGILEIRQSTRDQLAFLPPVSGAETASGEVYQGSSGSYVLVTPTAVVRIYTDGIATSTEAALEYLESLDVEWAA